MTDLKEILEQAQTIAIMGCSADPSRTSHRIAGYLKEAGYTIIPVNPNYDEVHGETCYPDIGRVPATTQIDIVNIFRAPEHTAEMVEQVVERIKATGEWPTIWTQLGVSSNEAKDLAQKTGMTYVKNRCIMVEHGRVIESA